MIYVYTPGTQNGIGILYAKNPYDPLRKFVGLMVSIPSQGRWIGLDP